MKVAGIVKVKYDKKRGLQYGDVIELSLEDKVKEAVKDAVKAMNNGDFLFWVDKVLLDKYSVLSAKGEKFHGKYSNNSYAANGKVVIRKMKADNNKLFPLKEYSFELRFCDCLDDINQPDLKVESFEYQ